MCRGKQGTRPRGSPMSSTRQTRVSTRGGIVSSVGIRKGLPRTVSTHGAVPKQIFGVQAVVAKRTSSAGKVEYQLKVCLRRIAAACWTAACSPPLSPPAVARVGGQPQHVGAGQLPTRRVHVSTRTSLLPKRLSRRAHGLTGRFLGLRRRRTALGART